LDYYGPMTRPKRRLALTLLTALACSGVWAAPPADAAEPPNSGLNSELFYQLLVGEMSARNGDAASAYSLLLDAARKTGSQSLYERTVEVALQARSGDSALMAAQAWAKAYPASQDANRYLLQILIGLNKIPETLEPIRRDLAGMAPKDRPSAIALLPRYFARATDKKQAAAVVEQALAGELASTATGPVAWSAIGTLRFLASDIDGAIEATRRGAALNAKAEEPILLALGLMDTKNPAAEAIVRKYLDNKPLPELRMAYARKLLDAQRYPEALVQMQVLTNEKKDYAEAWLVRGSLEFQEKQFAAAETSLKTYATLIPPATDGAEMDRGLVQAYLLLAQIAEQNQKFDVAQTYLQRINSPQDALRVQSRRAMILARQGKLEEGRALIRNTPETKEEDARAKVSAEVQLLRDNKQYAAAYELLSTAVQRFPQDIDLVYDQAMVAEKVQKVDDMEQLLRRVIAAKPDYHHAYNALGYSLADRNQRLPEARALITKALQFAPNDPYIVDSMGWLEFRSGNTEEALRLLQSAYQARPDAEIAAHMGEVLWSMGRQDQARAIWNEGKGLNPENETLVETIRRYGSKP
jgi:tetratricopeptide (TPR) repeat protein